MSERRIVTEDDAGVRVIAFDRPEARNAFDAPMYRAVTEALDGALGDDRIRAVVLTGRGTAFTAGQDLQELAALAAGDAAPDAGSGFQGLMDTVVSFDKPMLAAVNGVGVGLGCTLLGHVDLVLIDERARLRVPFAELGVPPKRRAAGCSRRGWDGSGPPSCFWPRNGSMPPRRWSPGWRSGFAPRAPFSRRPWPWPCVSPRSPPGATREIKRLMMASHQSDIGAARVREEAAYAALFADSANSAQLTAGLDR